MIKTVLIEDEVNARGSLRKILKLIAPNIEIIGETGYVKEAVKMINTLKPKLIFLDIKLEDGIGFDILKQLEYTSFKIIFTTAYNEYAIKAFKYSATDYLLKPINPLELKSALERAIISLNKETKHDKLLNVLKYNIEENDKKIVLKTTNNQHIVLVKDIIRLEADTAYTTFYVNNNKITVSKNLKYYQEILDDGFIRCHQSHLVNNLHIIGVHKKEFIKMSNEELIPISLRKKNEIIQQIKTF